MDSYNDIVYAVAKKARYLSDLSMDELRLAAGAILNQYRKRGELIELILTEEFCLENDKYLSSKAKRMAKVTSKAKRWAKFTKLVEAKIAEQSQANCERIF